MAWDTYDRSPVAFTWEAGSGTVVLLGFDLYERTEATFGLLRNAEGLPAAPSSTTGSEEVVRDVGLSEVEGSSWTSASPSTGGRIPKATRCGSSTSTN